MCPLTRVAIQVTKEDMLTAAYKKKKRNPVNIAFGRLIRERREHLGMSREELGVEIARRTKTKEEHGYNRVKQWENGDRFPRKILPFIADALDTTVEELFKGSDQLRFNSVVEGRNRIPVVEWGMIMETKDRRAVSPLGWVTPYQLEDTEAFATTVIDDSMRPIFRPGDVIIISPNTKPAPSGDYVVFSLKGQAIFREAHFYFDEIILMPLNPEFTTITVPRDKADLKIIGTVVQKIERFK